MSTPHVTPLAFTLLVMSTSALAVEPCTECHSAQANAWQASRHSRSAESPLYLAMRGWATSDAGEAVAARCVTCHTVSVSGSSARTPAVTCEVCHQAASAGPGPAALEVDPAVPVAAVGGSGSAPHAVVLVDAPAMAERCLVCHAELANPHGVPLCTTGPEAASRGPGPGCLDCHFRSNDHSAPGTTLALLGRAAEVTLSRRGRELAVAVLNRGAGHALPTGPALRQVVLEVRFLDRAGAELGHHRELFARSLADAEGNSPAPPWRAVKVLADSRLSAHESRSFSLPIPPRAARVTARLLYHRAPPPLLERLGLAGRLELEPVEMTRAERDLD